MSTGIKDLDEFNYAIKLLGDEYILHIVRNLGGKSMRFNELQRSVADICPATLADRLKKLEMEKIVIRQEETVDKLSVVYDLTPKGRGIIPIIKEISKFADKYV